MDFETEKIILNQNIISKEDILNIEDNIIIPDVKPDVLSIIDSSGNIYIYKKEIVNEKLKIDGGVCVNVMYVADNEKNEIKSIQTTLDFSKMIDINLNEKNNEDINYTCRADIKSIDCKILNGRKINLKISSNIKINVFASKEQNIIKSIANSNENIQMLKESIKVNILKCIGETVSSAKENITTDFKVMDILRTDINIINKEHKTSYNKVLSKADVLVNIMYLSEDEKILKCSETIPIMAFIDIKNSSENDIYDITYEIKNIQIKQDNVDCKNINFEIELYVRCEAYELKELNLIEDLYSIEKELEIESENVCFFEEKRNFKFNISTIEKVKVDDIEESKIIYVKVYPRILKRNYSKNSINYEGEILYKYMYISKLSGKLEVKENINTFNETFNIDGNYRDNDKESIIEVNSLDYSLQNDNIIEITTDCFISENICHKRNFNIIKDLKIKDIDQNTISSLIVYFVKSGDTLWKLAKKFKSTIDEIKKINNIENDKLDVGQQLFIPRYSY